MRALFLSLVLGVATLGLIGANPSSARAEGIPGIYGSTIPVSHYRGGSHYRYYRGGSHYYRGGSHYYYPGASHYYYGNAYYAPPANYFYYQRGSYFPGSYIYNGPGYGGYPGYGPAYVPYGP